VLWKLTDERFCNPLVNNLPASLIQNSSLTSNAGPNRNRHFGAALFPADRDTDRNSEKPNPRNLLYNKDFDTARTFSTKNSLISKICRCFAQIPGRLLQTPVEEPQDDEAFCFPSTSCIAADVAGCASAHLNPDTHAGH
jgi:hypothetical protein